MSRSLMFIPVLTISLATPGLAADLPRSGSFDLQTGLKVIGEATQVAEKHNLFTGKIWGVSFNTAGDGPLHMATLVCTNESEGIEGSGTNQGRCAWRDVDGDQVFAKWSGKFTPTSAGAGLTTITSGTGKYAGIEGNGPYSCQTLHAATGQYVCKQHIDYQLTASGSSMPSK